MKNVFIACLLLCTNVAISQNLGCLMIDFEEIGTDSLFEGMVISDQFENEFGLTFELESGGSPVLAQVGDPLSAFSSGFGSDTPQPSDAAEIGTFFLTDDGDWIDTADPIILNFTTPIDSFAGCILDMDGGEIFYIDAYDEFGGIILQDSIMAGAPDTGDGVSTCWGFNLMGCEGTVYQIKFSGFRPGGSFGMGLDNLSFCYSGISVELNLTNPSCSGDEDVIIEIISTDGIAYTYSLDGVNFTPDGIFTGLEPDSYDVYVMDPDGCMTSYDVSLQSSGSNSTESLQEEICIGDSLVINNVTYNTPGFYTQSLTNAAGCDSTLSIFISESATFMININETICSGDSLIINGVTYSQSGEYLQANSTAAGCDSNFIITLEVIDVALGSINETICSGDSLIINGTVYNQTGTYEQALITSSGCDSLLNIALTVASPNEGDFMASVCEGDSVLVNNTYYSIAGNYFQTLQTIEGCDSILNITVEMLPSFQVNQSYNLGSGGSVNVNGIHYQFPGNYEQLLTASNGCDSLILITIQPPVIECEDPCVGYIPIQEFSVTTQAIEGNNYSIKISDHSQETIYHLDEEKTAVLLELLDIESELGIGNNLFQEIHKKEKCIASLNYFSNSNAVKLPEDLGNYFVENFNVALSKVEITNLISKVKNQNSYILEKIRLGGTSKKSVHHRALK